MTTTRERRIARAVSAHLEDCGHAGLREATEAQLAGDRPTSYVDPVSVAGLVISIVSLALALASEHRERTQPTVAQILEAAKSDGVAKHLDDKVLEQVASAVADELQKREL